MKRAPLSHPRVFDEPDWAQGYYRRNAKNIERTGKRLAALLAESGFQTGTILDVGCGFGAVPIALARAFPKARVHGIDLAAPLLEIGRALVRDAGLTAQITLERGDARNLASETASADVVVNSYLLHIVDDPVAMLDEIERVARPDGRILITDLRRNWLGWGVRKLRNAYTRNEAETIIRQSRLRPGTCINGPFWWDYRIGI